MTHLRRVALPTALVTATLLPLATAHADGPRCDRVAAPGGNDVAPGRAAHPFRTAQRLVDSLRAGETGCLRPGVYRENVAIERGGRPGVPVTLRASRARTATLRGMLSVAESADDVRVEGLRLDGANARNAPSPQINGDRVTFSGNDVTNRHSSSCFVIGGAFVDYGIAHGTRLLDNRIERCGRLPATGHDHGIYVEGSDAALIRGNVIRDNADYGIQLYPRAIGSRIERNVIDRNGGGVIFAGESAGNEYPRAFASSGNVVTHNVISNSRRLPNAEAYWGGPVGTGNRLERNCLWARGRGNLGERRGFATRRNVVLNPRLDRSGARPRRRRCARLIGR